MNTVPPQWGLWATIAWGVVVAIFVAIVQSIVTFAGILANDTFTEDVSEQQIVDAASSGTMLSLATVATAILGTAVIAGRWAAGPTRRCAIPSRSAPIARWSWPGSTTCWRCRARATSCSTAPARPGAT